MEQTQRTAEMLLPDADAVAAALLCHSLRRAGQPRPDPRPFQNPSGTLGISQRPAQKQIGDHKSASSFFLY